MWNATQLSNDLQAEGFPLMKVRQGFQTMSPALKEVLRRMLRKELRHDGNPVMEWCVDNLAVAMDPAGNVKPDKASSADKIDGVSALCNAMSEAIGTAVEESAYDEHHGLLVV
jgi:phage terminase large subunit-like protein